MYEYHTLPNGLKIILSRIPSRVAYSGVYINVGSRDEQGDDEGIAHFIEHSLFKGTAHRRAYHILSRIDGVGGELNAFTTKEETCLYATSLGEHLERCLELYADILFHSTFPEAEIEKEKEVVLEEINSYRDFPAELIYDQFEELAYEGHPLAHNILGSKRNVRHFTAERLRRRLDSCYTPSRMVVTVVADVSMERLVKLCERYYGGYCMGDQNSPGCQNTRKERPVFKCFEHHVNRRTHQAHLLLGCEAPDIYSQDKTAFTLINNILGGPAMNSRLNVAVRERYGFCYNVESQYVPFSDTGLFYVYAGVDLDAEERALGLIRNELGRMVSDAMTPAALRKAQRQFAGQMAINNDNGLNEMQSIGKAYMNFDHVDTLDEMTSDIMALTPDMVRDVAARWFGPARYSTLVYGN
ncbi:MAG: insulinase family protein [Bacteroidales bacterium]|nr:insulinase family protein [Bacteroidales bacterium]